MGFFYSLIDSFIKKFFGYNRMWMMFVGKRNNFVDYEFNVYGLIIVVVREFGGREIMLGFFMEKF